MSFLMYLFLVSKFDLNKIYPITTGCIFICVMLGSFLVLKENIGTIQIVGSALILIGVVLLAIKHWICNNAVYVFYFERKYYAKALDKYGIIAYYYNIIFRAGCNSPPAVKPASLFGWFGETPKPTVKVRMKEECICICIFRPHFRGGVSSFSFNSPDKRKENVKWKDKI